MVSNTRASGNWRSRNETYGLLWWLTEIVVLRSLQRHAPLDLLLIPDLRQCWDANMGNLLSWTTFGDSGSLWGFSGLLLALALQTHQRRPFRPHLRRGIKQLGQRHLHFDIVDHLPEVQRRCFKTPWVSFFFLPSRRLCWSVRFLAV
ncbi:hypothetical protein BDW42DRAFT_105614 [Aspergillus taichungensis]|uniref:Uncharacterized protein n=1 Tax=Aspergillus taichungensis TaxID=482145 RepID=A0A2J5HUA3_9EURO|nr:hypothetical protein BDW42DRAFT_105614 [Aspergillus taichungensis]